MKEQLEKVGLVDQSKADLKQKGITLAAFLDDFVIRHGKDKKPATLIV